MLGASIGANISKYKTNFTFINNPLGLHKWKQLLQRRKVIDKIRNEAQYIQVMALIEKFVAKATDSGGFNFLTDGEKEELNHLSLLAERYEDDVLKIMPLPVTISSPAG